MKNDFNLLAFFQELGGIDKFFADKSLFKSFKVHKMISGMIFEEVLVFAAFDTGNINFHTGIKSVCNNPPGLQAFKFRPDESRTFSGFYMLKFHNQVQIIVVIDHQAVPDICGCCHKV